MLAYLVAYNIPGILPNAREPHVWTLASQIVVHPPREVAVVSEADEANDESPDVPLHNVFVTLRLVLGQEAADSALGRSWDTVCKRLIMNSLGTRIFSINVGLSIIQGDPTRQWKVIFMTDAKVPKCVITRLFLGTLYKAVLVF